MFKFHNPLRTPSAERIAREGLEEARREYLEHQARAEYHAKMAEYYANTIDRLTDYLENHK